MIRYNTGGIHGKNSAAGGSDNRDSDENAVVLMTMHSAKGLEFPFVFMPGWKTDCSPGWRALTEKTDLRRKTQTVLRGNNES